MLNQFVIVGSLKEKPELKETANKIKYAHITMIVKRNFKNSIGEYEYDEIVCTLWRGIAENCIDVCEENSLIAIKGRIQSSTYVSEENKSYINYEFIAEKVSFLNEA